MIRAVAYYRMSNEKQEMSIPAQRPAVEAYARKHGYLIVREYMDEGISGDETEKRLAFQRMQRDAQELADFQVILCWDQDRFGRFDPLEAGYWIKPFRDAGVRLETIGQGKIDWNDFHGRLVYIVQQEAKHAYLKDLSRNVLRGHLAGHARGEWQGLPPFGYRLLNKRLVPDEEKAAIVRLIFERYAAGDTLRSLTAWLNLQGITTPRGKCWVFPNLRDVLTNPAYVGTFRYGGKSRAKYNHLGENGEIVPGKNSKVPHFIERENNHPAIVDRALFDKVQRLLAARKGKANVRKTIYALGGLLRCGHCGGSMVGKRYIWKGHPRSSYLCSIYHLSGKAVCHRNTIHEDMLLACVLRKLSDFWKVPDNIERVTAALRAECTRDNTYDAHPLQERLAQLNGQIERGAKRLLAAPDSIYAELVAELDAAKKEKAEVEARLATLDRTNAVASADMDCLVSEALAQLEMLETALRDADPSMVRAALAGLISHIELHFRNERRTCYGRSFFERGTIHARPGLEIVQTVGSVQPMTLAKSCMRKRSRPIALSWSRTLELTE
jgi:DNA invertase Pin-like site-specific DNA recombinase